jgi:hypothetical protein
LSTTDGPEFPARLNFLAIENKKTAVIFWVARHQEFQDNGISGAVSLRLALSIHRHSGFSRKALNYQR